MKRSLYLLVFRFTLVFFIPQVIFAQYSESINSGRPGQSIGASVIGTKVFQIQSGYQFNRVDDLTYYSNTTTSNTVLRFGLSERLELSSSVLWRNEAYHQSLYSFYSGGLAQLQIGGRVNLLQNKGLLPDLAIQARTILPIKHPRYRTNNFGGVFILSTVNKITETMAVNINLGISNDGKSGLWSSFYVLNYSLSITPKLGCFAEAYGNFDPLSLHTDAGIYYLFSSDFQLDFSVGWQGQQTRKDWFVDMGLSWRIDWRDTYKQQK